MAEREPRKRWGNRDTDSGLVYPRPTKREAVSMANWARSELVASEWTGTDWGWSDWEVVRS